MKSGRKSVCLEFSCVQKGTDSGKLFCIMKTAVSDEIMISGV